MYLLASTILIIWAVINFKIEKPKNTQKESNNRHKIKYERYLVTELFSVEKYFEKKNKLEIVEEKFMYTTLWGNEPLECVEVTYWVTERKRS